MRFWTVPLFVTLAAALACTPGADTTTADENPSAEVDATPEAPAPEAAAPEEMAPETQTASAGDLVTTESGLQYEDLVVGDGASPVSGQTVIVHYTGTLEDGSVFDSSVERGQPFSFPIGTGRVIRGWDEGVMTMAVGGKRRLIIPANLAYGARALPGIPANSTLIFEVELLDLR